MTSMPYFTKAIAIPVLLFLANSCCWEEYSEHEWEIVNNSNDTIFVTQLQYPFSDSIAILPREVFNETALEDGKGKRFSCAKKFELSATVAVSGGKTLTREIDDDDNWIQLSDYSACKGEHKCSFRIEQTDIK